MAYSPLVNFLVNATRKSAKILLRDYFELENLQNSKRPTTQFVAQARLKVKDGLIAELLRYPNSVIVQDEKIPEAGKDIYFVINPIDGELNLGRAIPFFGIIIVACEHKNGTLSPLASMVDLPALGDMAYAENGRGAFLERSVDNSGTRGLRLRVSAHNLIENALVVGDSGSFAHQRKLGSDIYSSILVASGKADIFLSDSMPFATRLAAIHLIQEAGGRAQVNKTISGQLANFIADNGQFKF